LQRKTNINYSNNGFQLPKKYYFSRLEIRQEDFRMKLIFRHLFFIFPLLASSLAGLAQQAPSFTHHAYTHAFTNPGFAGLSEGICINGIVRQQWAGFKDMEGNKVAPETFLVTGDTPMRKLKGGLGLSVIQDKLGFESNVGVQLGYSYHLDLGSATLGIGTAANFLNRSVDFSKFKPHASGDPILATGEQSDMLFDVNFGLFLHIPDVYYLGVSMTSALESKGKALTDNSSSSFVGDRTVYLVGGYQFVAPWNAAYEFHPAISVVSNFSSTQINMSGNIVYNNQFWGGVNYRLQESIGLMVGMTVLDLRIGYAYDVNTMRLGVPGSHEISLGYCFKIKADKSIRTYRNTRYL
jgi:type IX secretion system PorP/SprF family membrane protein